MSNHEKINYLEIPAKDIEQTKAFFNEVFGWSFMDYGPEYIASSDAGIDIGFFKSTQSVQTGLGSALIILYSDTLEDTHQKIERAQGKILKPIYSFPGGRRFHFADPNGNEFAVWGESEISE